MWDSFLATLSPMLVMLLCIVVGFLLRKTKAAPENTAAVLSKMEINVFLPALILRTFLTYCTVESISKRYTTILYGAIAIALAAVIGSVLAKFFTKDKNEFKIYRYSLMVANFGFLGNAIVPAIMGQEMMYNGAKIDGGVLKMYFEYNVPVTKLDYVVYYFFVIFIVGFAVTRIKKAKNK